MAKGSSFTTSIQRLESVALRAYTTGPRPTLRDQPPLQDPAHPGARPGLLLTRGQRPCCRSRRALPLRGDESVEDQPSTLPVDDMDRMPQIRPACATCMVWIRRRIRHEVCRAESEGLSVTSSPPGKAVVPAQLVDRKVDPRFLDGPQAITVPFDPEQPGGEFLGDPADERSSGAVSQDCLDLGVSVHEGQCRPTFGSRGREALAHRGWLPPPEGCPATVRAWRDNR